MISCVAVFSPVFVAVCFLEDAGAGRQGSPAMHSSTQNVGVYSLIPMGLCAVVASRHPRDGLRICIFG